MESAEFWIEGQKWGGARRRLLLQNHVSKCKSFIDDHRNGGISHVLVHQVLLSIP